MSKKDKLIKQKEKEISKLENKMGSCKNWVATMNNPYIEEVKKFAKDIGKATTKLYDVPIIK